MRTGISALDVGGGTWLALGVVTALLQRSRTGRGGEVATSLFETGATWVSYHIAAHQFTGLPSQRHGSGHPAFAPYGIFAAADGEVCLGVASNDHWHRVCRALAADDLAADPDYAENVGRVQHAERLRRELEQLLQRIPAAEVVRRLSSVGVACDVVQRPEELLGDPQAEAVGLWVDQEVAGFGTLRFPGLPLRLNGRRPSIRFAE